MTDLLKMERGKEVYVLTLNRIHIIGESEHSLCTTYYLPSKKSVRLLVRMYISQYGYRLTDFTLRYFNTGLVVSEDCDAPHYNLVNLGLDKVME